MSSIIKNGIIMKRYIVLVIMTVFCLPTVFSQSAIYKLEGTCGEDTKWVFDGYTLTIRNASKNHQPVVIQDYDLKNQKSPWAKKLSVKRVQIERLSALRLGKTRSSEIFASTSPPWSNSCKLSCNAASYGSHEEFQFRMFFGI